MNPAIGREFHFASLIRFALPTIIMMIFMSLYTIVDGIFISRFVGTDALSATNIVYPMINIVLAVAIMLATGGSAVVARKMGEGKTKSAKQSFTFIVISGTAAGAVIGLLGIVFLEPICLFLGASAALMEYCKSYLFVLLLFAPAAVLQILFQSFFVTAGRPMLGLLLTVIAGVGNAVFDYLFIVPLGMGVAGAALATAMGYLLPSAVGLIYFSVSKNALHFCRPKLDWRMLAGSCLNGSSEMVTNLSTGIITFLFNILMMRYLGENGVAAITIVIYAQFLLTALYMGFSMGVAPVISFNYGSGNTVQLQRIFRICMIFIALSSVAMYGASLLLSEYLVAIFAPVGSAVYEVASHGFWLFSLSFLFAGINIFASGMFTALSNGKVSALISFMRTFAFILVGLLLLPRFLDVDGIWLAVPFAEILTMGISVVYLKKMSGVYQYA